MNMKTKYYNRKSLQSEIEKRTGYVFSYIVLCNYEKKGFIRSSGSMPNGNRQVPVYTDSDIEAFIARIPELDQLDKIRVKTSDGKNTTTEAGQTA